MSLFTVGSALFVLAMFILTMVICYQSGKTQNEKKPLIVLAAVVPLVALGFVGAVINDCAKDPAALAWYYDNMSMDAMNANVDKVLVAHLRGECVDNKDCEFGEVCTMKGNCLMVVIDDEEENDDAACEQNHDCASDEVCTNSGLCVKLAH